MSRGYTGEIAGVTFTDGRPTNPDQVDAGTIASIQAYAQRHGLAVDGDRLIVVEDEVDYPGDVQDIVVVGTKLRDAAVDPRASDFLPPVNAGLAHPHSPLVVSPQIHGTRERPVTPGEVPVGQPAAQEAKETAAVAELTEVELGRPARNASKADWQAYAIAQGMEPQDAAAAKRDDLAALYPDDEQES